MVARSHERKFNKPIDADCALGKTIPGLGVWVGFHGADFVGCWMLQPPHGPDQRQVPGEADLGYRLLRRWWRQGLASEGAHELLRYGFVDVGLRRIFAQTLAVNQPSRAVMASIGMTYVRTFPSQSPEPLVAGSDCGGRVRDHPWAVGSGSAVAVSPASRQRRGPLDPATAGTAGPRLLLRRQGGHGAPTAATEQRGLKEKRRIGAP